MKNSILFDLKQRVIVRCLRIMHRQYFRGYDTTKLITYENLFGIKKKDILTNVRACAVYKLQVNDNDINLHLQC